MIIACHYDSKLEPRGGVFASDSAVPCAMMLNLAKTMKEELREQKKSNQDLTIQFLFFDGEEAFKRWTSTDSIYGSRRLASDWEKKPFSYKGVSGNHNDRIDIFVLLDLLGALSGGLMGLRLAGEEVRPSSLSCSDTVTWQQGYTLTQRIRATKFVGETGSVILDKETGLRTNLTVSVMKMTKQGLVTDAYWSPESGYLKSKGKF